DLGSCYTGTISGGAQQDLTKTPAQCRDDRDPSVAAVTSKTACTTAGYKWQYGCADGTAGCCWNNWVFAGTYNGNDQCLRCHNTAYMVGHTPDPAPQAAKESYLKTGHKNMLRKVTGGMNWAGADGVVYTTDGTNAINFNNGGNATITIATASCSVAGVCSNTAHTTAATCVSPEVWTPYSTQATCEAAGKTWTDSGDRPLFYIYGDWMAVNPSVVYGRLNSDPLATNGYSCAACHSTGFSNSTAGLCSDNTSTTQTACTGAGATWVQSVGVQGVVGLEPGASFPGIKGITGNWDLNGINCSRCHASTYPAVAGTSTHNNTPSGTAITNLCFGCHQSMGKIWPAGTSGSIDPTVIPTGINHGASAGRDFNGHVLGNSFLNSPHAKFSGTVVPNTLGKFDLSAAGTYNSAFDGGAGSCTTCHDVHNSLFVEGQNGIKEECVGCHENAAVAAPQVVDSTMVHPRTAGTPWDATKYGNDPCAVCHMATQAEENGNQNSMPVHLWRINTSATYNTFPTADQFNGTNGATKDRNAQTAPDGAYTNAVWVDLDLACGQCHGGSLGTCSIAGNTTAAACSAAGGVWTPATANGAPAFDKTQLSAAAKSLHAGGDDSGCLSCHSTTQNGYRAVNQGVNHHSGSCTGCHKGKQHQGNPVLPGVTYTITTNTAGLKQISTTLIDGCLSCHSTPQGTVGAIIPTSAYGADNHHRGHAYLPGQSGTDPGMYCLGCHGSGVDNGDGTWSITGSGLPTATVSAAKGMLPNANNTPGINATSVLCTQCHSNVDHGHGYTAQETAGGIEKNHHSGNCTTCHHTDGSWSGTYPAGVGSGPNVLVAIDSNSRDSVTTYCLQCHASVQTKFAGGTDRALIVSGTGDNHHRGSSTSTARSVAGCLYCHGEVGGVPFGGADTEAVLDKPAGAVSPCQSCHGIVQSGATQDHHAGDCLTCHLNPKAPFPGDTDGLVGADATSRDAVTTYCLACHSAAQGSSRAIVPSGTGDNHHNGSSTSTSKTVAGCLYCHGDAGGVPFGGSETEVMQQQVDPNTCNGSCHASTLPSAKEHHNGEGMTLTNNTFCLTCHTPTTTLVPNPGVPASATLDPLSRDTVTTYCQACHAAPQGSHRAIVPSGTGDNHHRGSSTSTSNSVAGCLYCHGDTGGVKFGEATNENMQDSVAYGSCSGACHASSQAASGTHHPGTGLALTNNTLCLTCHLMPANLFPGKTDVVITPECSACHTVEYTNNKHVTGSGTPDKTLCETCHVGGAEAVGVKPTSALCQACHTGLGVVVADATVNNRMVNIHGAAPTAAFSMTITGTTAKLSGMASACPSGTCTFQWATDNGTITNPTAMGTSITGGTPGAVNVTLFISDPVSGAVASKTKAGTFVQSNRAPVAVFAAGYPSLSGWTLTVKDASTDPD
ncbi:MAG: hypothetical protein LUO89_13895, partial [Methanothrix sp.]|nr:hypothetical protein [Methanothrix sp.]